MQDGAETAVVLANPPALTRRACDRCFSLKERCTWSKNQIECDRCCRISKPCSSERPVRRTGRRPRYSLSRPPSLEARIPPSLQPFSFMFKNLEPFEESMMIRSLDPTFFNELMTVPRVGREMHQQALHSLLHSWEETHDGCFSMFGAFAAAKSIEIPGYDPEENLVRGTRALEKFRTMPSPATSQESMPWLWLGIAVLIYAHCGLGYSGTPVRRYILSHLSSNIEQRKLLQHPSVVSLIALDIHESLLHHYEPVVNVPSCATVGTDTFLGLCAPLVRLSYELAKLSHSYGDGYPNDDQLSQLAAAVEAWQPDIPLEWRKNLSLIEATHVLAEARVHKTMMLLFAHRLRHPFGQEDAVATRMAHSIVSELDLAAIATGQAPMWSMTPFIVASIESIEVNERVKTIQNVPIYGDKVSRKSQELAKTFLESLWAYRDAAPGFRWIDMMAHLPPLCVYV